MKKGRGILRRAWLLLGVALAISAGVVALRTVPFGAHAFRPDAADAADAVGHGDGAASPPAGVGQVSFARDARSASASVSGGALRAGEHVYSLLLVDAASGRPLPLYYSGRTEVASDASGVVTRVTIRFDEGQAPGALRAYYLVDSQPAARGAL